MHTCMHDMQYMYYIHTCIELQASRTYINLRHTYIQTLHTCIHTYIHKDMPANLPGFYSQMHANTTNTHALNAHMHACKHVVRYTHTCIHHIKSDYISYWHTYILTCIHMRITDMHPYMHTPVHVRITHMHACMHASVLRYMRHMHYAHPCIHATTHAQTWLQPYMHACAAARKCTYIYAHVHSLENNMHACYT